MMVRKRLRQTSASFIRHWVKGISSLQDLNLESIWWNVCFAWSLKRWIMTSWILPECLMAPFSYLLFVWSWWISPISPPPLMDSLLYPAARFQSQLFSCLPCLSARDSPIYKPPHTSPCSPPCPFTHSLYLFSWFSQCNLLYLCVSLFIVTPGSPRMKWIPFYSKLKS